MSSSSSSNETATFATAKDKYGIPLWIRRVAGVAVFVGASTALDAMTLSSQSLTSKVANYAPPAVAKSVAMLWLASTLLTDPLRSAWPFTLAYLVPLITMYYASLGVYHIVVPMVFGIVPLIELVGGDDHSNPTKEQEVQLRNSKSFRYVTWVWVPLQLFHIAWAMYVAQHWDLSGADLVWLTISVGVSTGGLGINIAHELIHKPPRWEKLLGRILLVSSGRPDFYVEHLWGHHKMVSTPHDPASSRYNESFYAFLPRTLVGSFCSAWAIAAKRTKASGLAAYSPLSNELTSLLAAEASLVAACYYAFGAHAIAMFAGQAFVASTLLELVNYVEHYGLERKEASTSTGYEAVTHMHSWNASTPSSLLLFKLDRHSDHHETAGKRYQTHISHAASPQLPTGYAGMIVTALVPPLWKAIMNPRVDKLYNKQA